jgi:hypothetical protein
MSLVELSQLGRAGRLPGIGWPAPRDTRTLGLNRVLAVLLPDDRR